MIEWNLRNCSNLPIETDIMSDDEDYNSYSGGNDKPTDVGSALKSRK